MKAEFVAHLHDALQAAKAVKNFVAGRKLSDYAADEMLRSAVERKFEIIGESLNRIRRLDPGILLSVRDHRNIISFRNILVHGYDSVDDLIVWGVIEEDLDRLIDDLEKLLRE